MVVHLQDGRFLDIGTGRFSSVRVSRVQIEGGARAFAEPGLQGEAALEPSALAPPS